MTFAVIVISPKVVRWDRIIRKWRMKIAVKVQKWLFIAVWPLSPSWNGIVESETTNSENISQLYWLSNWKCTFLSTISTMLVHLFVTVYKIKIFRWNPSPMIERNSKNVIAPQREQIPNPGRITFRTFSSRKHSRKASYAIPVIINGKNKPWIKGNVDV